MSTKREGGLSRWARRKAAARAERATPEQGRGAALPPAAPAAIPAKPQPATAKPVEAEAATPPDETKGVDLPDIETLDYDSDYSAFLSGDVSDAVRNIALRKLWRSNPLLANVDGLVDYDDDFSDAATVIEGMKTVYRTGRGMVRDETEEATQTAATDADGRHPDDAPYASSPEPEADQEGSDVDMVSAPTEDDEKTSTRNTKDEETNDIT